jgi:hypothetical protein
LEGEPGLTRLTEKGRSWSSEQFRATGRSLGGGPSGHELRTWDPDVTGHLDLSPERKAEVIEALRVRRLQQGAELRRARAEADSIFNAPSPEMQVNPKLVAAVGVFLAAASAYGVYRAAPHISRWWKSRSAVDETVVESAAASAESVAGEQPGDDEVGQPST